MRYPHETELLQNLRDFFIGDSGNARRFDLLWICRTACGLKVS